MRCAKELGKDFLESRTANLGMVLPPPAFIEESLGINDVGI
jgi:hypothetical protein